MKSLKLSDWLQFCLPIGHSPHGYLHFLIIHKHNVTLLVNLSFLSDLIQPLCIPPLLHWITLDIVREGCSFFYSWSFLTFTALFFQLLIKFPWICVKEPVLPECSITLCSIIPYPYLNFFSIFLSNYFLLYFFNNSSKPLLFQQISRLRYL